MTSQPDGVPDARLYAVEPGAGRRHARRRRRGRLSLVVIVLVLAASVAYAVESRRGPEVWPDGSANGQWLAVFNGLGSTQYDDGVIRLAPRAAERPDETHAGLVVSMKWYEAVDYSVSMRTVEQLRSQKANPWEVGWVVWHYTDDEHFYYFALKPNGWELGKADPAFDGSQRFLATGERPAGYDEMHRVRIRQIADTLDVWVDGEPVVTYRDQEDPYLRGAVGVYCEDAVVEFSDIEVTPALTG